MDLIGLETRGTDHRQGQWDINPLSGSRIDGIRFRPVGDLQTRNPLEFTDVVSTPL